jgi:hypothetical protein
MEPEGFLFMQESGVFVGHAERSEASEPAPVQMLKE